MVHKKYIKRGNKVFGPYLYENYRENGVVKTRYLGVGKKKKTGRRLKINKIFLLGIILLILFLLILIGLFLGSRDKEFFGELASQSPINFLVKLFTTSSPINVFVKIIGNTPPEFMARPSEILVCENTALDYLLSVRDTDGDSLDLMFEENLGISFYFNPNPTKEGNILSNVSFYTSRILTWIDINKLRYNNDLNNGWAVYPETLIVTDRIALDSFDTNIIIIEVNNPPEFNIGTKTLYVRGDDNVFYYDLGAYLESQGEETPKSNLTYKLIFLSGTPFFNISNRGIMNVTGNESFILPGQNSTTYNLELCVNDTGLIELGRILHQNISICLQGNPPQSADALRFCDNFSLTVTKENRRPIITSYYPLNLSLNITGTDNLYFNITARDPDWNPVDVYWYVDGAQKKYFEALYENNLSEFEYIFGCEISGNHTVKSVITDGLLNASVQWNLSVKYVECPKPQPPGIGGGGGIGKLYCEEKWGCNDWMQCQNLNELVKGGWTSKETELLIKERCEIFNYVGDFCGFQTRLCTDFNYCKTKFEKPPFIRECYYTENPNCTDGIKNCHDGSCEVLVDCGGSCELCPTCNDKIQNQGEERIDCGGPCEPCKELPFRPILFKSVVTYSLIALLILVLVLVIKEIREYYSSKKRVEKGGIKNLIKQEKKTYVYRALFIIFVVLLLFFANVYITKFTQESVISGVSKIGEGALASYGFINNLLRSLGVFFVTGPITSWDNDAKLLIGDDSDSESRYSGQNFYFYADYNYTSGGPIITGSCRIRFDSYLGYSNWSNMVYNGISKFRYNTAFNYKGEYDFEVECSENGEFVEGSSPGFVRVGEKFEVVNTPPIFKPNTWEITYHGFEDIPLIYNFALNVTDPDFNDRLSFDFQSINLKPVSDYPWISLNSSTGIMVINSTLDSEAQNFKISVKVLDSNDVGELREFNFNIALVNDAPIFLNLTNKTFNEGDLFEYVITVQDEEWNTPFKFNISFVSCNAPGRSNCTLFTQYSVDEMLGRINISFTPSSADIGSYIINFSVMDNSNLGNKTSSVLVNFTVTPALWNNTVQLDYLLIEGDEFTFNLTNQTIGSYQEDVVFFSNKLNSNFPSFSIVNGIINFTPDDEDVGENFVEITASSQGINSSRIFNFTILNQNDSVDIQPLSGQNVNISPINSKVDVYENVDAVLVLGVKDDDFLVPQKNFYRENLTLNWIIEGPNPNLFEFIESELATNIMEYRAEFSTASGDIGDYNITVNVSDANNFSFDILKFNLTVVSRNYNMPNITYPDESTEFNMKEGVNSSLIFRVNHSVGDDLIFEFYINGSLRDSFLGCGNDTNVTWQFAPNFTEETYGNKTDLTLIVRNQYYPDLKINRTWNLTINHTNCPVMFIKEITDKGPVSYPYEFGIDLMDYFYDADYYDEHYNNTSEGILKFEISSNVSDTKITQRFTSNNWVYLSSFAATIEELNINASDNESFILSNNFTVIFVPPETVQVPTPTSGSSQTIPIALKIIMPGRISAYEHEKIEIPLQLVNSGQKSFDDLTLISSAFKNGSIVNWVNTSLSKNYFKSLAPGQKEDLNLTVFFDTDKIGDYEVLVNVTSKSPKYTDWGKIHINLQKINESQVRELIIFTQEFIVKNPQCIEIQEIVKEAEKLFEQGDYANAKIKSEQAVEACKESISQVSVPKKKTGSFEVSLYLVFTILLAFVLGIAYYFFKRRKIQKMKNLQEVKLRAMQEAKPST